MAPAADVGYRRSMHLSRLGLLLCLAACGPDKTTSDSTSDGPTTSDTTTFGDTTFDDTTSDMPTTGTDPTTTSDDATDTGDTTGVEPACECPAEDCGAAICDLVEQRCQQSDDCMNIPEELVDEASLQCTLEALRDRTPGGLSWMRIISAGLVTDVVKVWVLDDGTAYVARAGNDDFDAYIGSDGYHVLEDPAYFAGCLAELDVIARLDCLRGGVLEQTQECVPFQRMNGGDA